MFSNSINTQNDQAGAAAAASFLRVRHYAAMTRNAGFPVSLAARRVR